MSVYWVGSRESDTYYIDYLFSGSIVLYGNAENPRSINHQLGKHINNNIISKELLDAISRNIEQVIADDANAEFLFYDPSWAHLNGLSEYQERFLCVNDAQLYENLNNKVYFRSLIEGTVAVLDSALLYPSECSVAELRARFDCPDGKFVIQEAVSMGGEGTFCVDENNIDEVVAQLRPTEKYIVTVYRQANIPVNANVLIADDDIMILPASVQLIKNEENRLMYRGADFTAYTMIPEEQRRAFEESVYHAAEKVRGLGYRGVCGIDGILCGSCAYILELNPRFQSSTALVNKALSENGLPSVQQMNINIFKHDPDPIPKSVADILVPYSSYAYHQNEIGYESLIYQSASSEPFVADIHSDGYESGMKIESGMYLFRLVFRGNISYPNANGGVNIHELVAEPDVDIYRKIQDRDILALKIALLCFGLRIVPDAWEWLIRNGGIRPGNNNAVDIEIFDLIINAPLDIKFIGFSPFEIRLEADELVLYYYDARIERLTIYPLDPLADKKTSRGVPYTTVAFLSTDRLRVHMTNECIYKTCGKSCQFCNIVPGKDPIDIEDIREVVKDYIYHAEGMTHFLVGGQSMGQEMGKRRIIEMVAAIRQYEKHKHIYVMALPYDKPTIRSLVKAGMNEIACNIEIFDEKLAKKYMPGKGAIPRETYFDVLEYAVTLLPQKGAVRSMLILGLESDESFISGVTKLVERGIQPIISIMRPLPDTPLEDYIAPSVSYIYQMYDTLETICRGHDTHLGPACVHCQNNTLSLPYIE